MPVGATSNILFVPATALSLLLIFFGGALGALSRWAISLLINPIEPTGLALTFVVNLSGALLLGFVNTHSYFSSITKRVFFGHGFLGSFTTMSALAMITAGQDLGLTQAGWFYWVVVVVQLLLGIFAYAAGVSLAGKKNK